MDQQELIQYQELCSFLCGGQNYEKKKQAESILYKFLRDWQNAQKLQQVLLYAQDMNTIFITTESLLKIMSKEEIANYPQKAPDTDSMIEKSSFHEDVYNITDPLLSTLFEYLEKNLAPLQSYVLNSIANLFSYIVQVKWTDSLNPHYIIEKIYNTFIKGYEPSRIIVALTLFDSIVSNINTYNSDLSFWTFRKRIINFRNYGLWLILIYAEEIFKLAFSEVNNNITETSLKILSKVAKVLSVCFNFTFSIGYFEQEVDNEPNEPTVVQFPDKWSTLFVNQEYLQSLLNAYIFLLNGGQTYESLQILKCFQKIFMTRLSIFEKSEKKVFFQNCYLIILTILGLPFKNQPEINMELIELNNTMISNVRLRKLRKNEAVLNEWVAKYTNYTLFLLSLDRTISSEYCPRVFNVWRKIIKQSYDMKLPSEITQYLRSCVSQLLERYLWEMSNSQQTFINPESKYRDFKKFIKMVRLFFNSFKELFISNLPKNQMLLQPLLLSFKENFIAALNLPDIDQKRQRIAFIQDKLVFIIGFALCTVTSISREEMILFYDEILEEEREKNQIIEARCVELIALTEKCEIHYNEELILTLIGFTDIFITQNLDDKSKVEYLNLAFTGRTQDQFFSQSFEIMIKFLINCLKLNNLNSFNYSLLLIRTIVTKIKAKLPRESFKVLPFITYISGNILEVKNSILDNKPSYKCRKDLFETLSLIWIDDTLDNYIENLDHLSQDIKNFYNLSTQQNSKETFIKVFRDYLGILSAIDLPRIYYFFFKINYPLIQELLCLLASSGFMKDQNIMASCLDFIIMLLDNKSQRISTYSSSPIGYQLLRDISKFVQSFYTLALGDLQITGFESLDAKEKYRKIKLFVKSWKIFYNFHKGKYVNFNVFNMMGDDSVLVYVKNTLESIFFCSNEILFYPKHCDVYINLITEITEHLLGSFSGMFEKDFFSKIFLVVENILNKFLNETTPYHDLLISSEEAHIEKASTVITNVCIFFYEELRSSVSQSNENIKYLLMYSTVVLDRLIETLINKSLAYIKMERIQGFMIRGVFPILLIYPQGVETLKRVLIQHHNETLVQDEPFFTLFKDFQSKMDYTIEDKFRKQLKLVISRIDYLQEMALKEKNRKAYSY